MTPPFDPPSIPPYDKGGRPRPSQPPFWDQVFRRSAALVTCEIAGETLLVPMRGKLAQLQRIFALNPVGAFIWEQLDGERDLAAIHEAVVEHFEVSPQEAREDLVAYVTLLREAELICAAPPAPPQLPVGAGHL